MAPSSSGLGRRPLKAEIAGSNPVGATIKKVLGTALFSKVYQSTRKNCRQYNIKRLQKVDIKASLSFIKNLIEIE